MKPVAIIAACCFAWGWLATAADLGGVKAQLDRYAGSAVLNAQLVAPHKLRLQLDRRGETQPLLVRVELPKSGPQVWPEKDVEVRDASGRALLVRRSGIEWSTLLIPVPEGLRECFVQAVPPPGGWPRPTPEKERQIADNTSGFHLRIARWPLGRAAALSLRFDDSHPTHLTKVVPILREHGFRGTFMINPGASDPGSRRVSNYERHRAEWEALAKQGDHEFANHSARHRGAQGDEDMEREIGEAAEVIWKLFPGRSKLTALNLGGGTQWETTRTLRFYLDKFHHFDASGGSLGMDDVYGNRVAAFRRALEQHLERGLWCRVHYHYIGEGLSSSEANFRAALEVAKQHQDRLWIAGMADIHKYQTERDTTKLSAKGSHPGRLEFQVTCGTDPQLYDQPMTVELVRAPALVAERIRVQTPDGSRIPLTLGRAADDLSVLRFEIPARDATYSIEATP